jgi:hypothetical protein
VCFGTEAALVGSHPPRLTCGQSSARGQPLMAMASAGYAWLRRWREGLKSIFVSA